MTKKSTNDSNNGESAVYRRLTVCFGSTEFDVQIKITSYVHELITNLLLNVHASHTRYFKLNQWFLVKNSGFRFTKSMYIGYNPDELEDFDLPEDYRPHVENIELPKDARICELDLSDGDQLRLLRHYICNG